jgi:hypothetical protein
MLEDSLLDLFMCILKERIQHEVQLLELKLVEHAFSVSRNVESKNMATRRETTNNYRENHVLSPNLTQPIMWIPQQMDKTRVKELCFICDNKYSKGHKYGETKLFYIYCE